MFIAIAIVLILIYVYVDSVTKFIIQPYENSLEINTASGIMATLLGANNIKFYHKLLDG